MSHQNGELMESPHGREKHHHSRVILIYSVKRIFRQKIISVYRKNHRTHAKDLTIGWNCERNNILFVLLIFLDDFLRYTLIFLLSLLFSPIYMQRDSELLSNRINCHVMSNEKLFSFDISRVVERSVIVVLSDSNV